MTAAAARRAPRERIGFDEAHRWARSLDLKNPYAKSILRAIALYMNEDGAAWPGTATIARDTDISEDTVVRRLRWLEQIGAIAILKRWKDENGRANYDGRGKPTSNEIRFLFDADKDEIERRARGESEPDDDETSPRTEREQGQDSSPRRQRELNEPSSRVAPEQPPQGERRHIEDEPEQEETPQSPPEGGGVSDVRFEKFKQAYPIPILNNLLTRQLFSALTDLEQDAAIAGAEAYGRFCKAEKRRHTDAHRWLRKREWEGFTGKAMPASAKPRLFVPKDSEAGRAWQVFDGCYGRTPLSLHSSEHRCEGYWQETEFPPFGRGLDPDQWNWVATERGLQQWHAWQERLRECRGTGSPSRLMTIDGRTVQGWKFPTEWPPPKHAKESTGPPAAA